MRRIRIKDLDGGSIFSWLPNLEQEEECFLEDKIAIQDLSQNAIFAKVSLISKVESQKFPVNTAATRLHAPEGFEEVGTPKFQGNPQ